ncbi:MAG: metallophosphoesterase [Rhodopirellula sp.]|nr:metallophosphoesterase [Rhodopirellula sp.]
MIWLHLLWFAILSIGNAEILVTAVNRLHSKKIHEPKLRHVRHLHDLLIPLWPVWLLVVIGCIRPGVLFNETSPTEVWLQQPLMIQAWMAICMAGFAGFSWSVIRYWIHRPARQQIEFKSTVVNYKRELGATITGEGPYSSLLNFPMNECFKVEFTERTFQLDRLPREWDGLTILHLTDLHFTGTIDLPFFEAVFERAAQLDYDIAVITGDILDSDELYDWLPRTLGQLNAPLGNYFILGNHDWGLDSDRIRQAICNLGWRNVAGTLQTLDIAGKRLAIGGSERPWMGCHPAFDAVPDNTFRLLLSHTPDNLSWARRQRVDLMLSGHNHGGQVVIPGIGPAYSPSVHGCRYAAGVFQSKSTLLFVGRGLSGKHPLRIGATPEVTRIILKATSSR